MDSGQNEQLDDKIERLLQSPYWIIDILPKQVPKDSAGQYFMIEGYYLEERRLAAIKQKHVGVILKLNCYMDVTIEGELNLTPEKIAEIMTDRCVYIMVGDSMILSGADDTHMKVFNPNEELLELIRLLASAEGLFVWQP